MLLAGIGRVSTSRSHAFRLPRRIPRRSRPHSDRGVSPRQSRDCWALWAHRLCARGRRESAVRRSEQPCAPEISPSAELHGLMCTMLTAPDSAIRICSANVGPWNSDIIPRPFLTAALLCYASSQRFRAASARTRNGCEPQVNSRDQALSMVMLAVPSFRATRHAQGSSSRLQCSSSTATSDEASDFLAVLRGSSMCAASACSPFSIASNRCYSGRYAAGTSGRTRREPTSPRSRPQDQ